MLDVYKSQKIINNNSINTNNGVNGNSSVINLKPIQTNSKKRNSKKKKKKTTTTSENVVTTSSSSSTTIITTAIQNTKETQTISTNKKQSSFESVSLIEMTSSNLNTNFDSSTTSINNTNHNTPTGSRNQSIEIKSLDGFSSTNSLRRLDNEQYNEKDLLSNTSLRWHNQSDNESDEKVRIELYKLNRRKRYIEQRNRFFLPPIFNDNR